MKNIKIFATFLVASALTLSCSEDYLTKRPLGSVDKEAVKSKSGVEVLTIGAYSWLNPEHANWGANPNNWVYGDIAGGDAYKGSEPGDQPDINAIEKYASQANNGYLNEKWNWAYNGIFRCNDAIAVIKGLETDAEMTEEFLTQKTAEIRFLRGFYYFELFRLFGPKVPWIDESFIEQGINNPLVKNDKDITANIQADFLFASQNLPEKWGDVGRVNVWAAKAFLAKFLLYNKDYTGAKTLFDDVILNGITNKGEKYKLLPSFEMNFNLQYENSSESVFAVQNTVDVTRKHGNPGYSLGYPHGNTAPGGCCGFFQPSTSLVNSFKVDGQGLPLFDTFNQTDLKNDMGITSAQSYTPDNTTPVDPRLDWTVGRRGIPYLNWGINPGMDWVRMQSNGGPYLPMKHVYRNGDPTEKQDWWAPGSALNVVLMRFADVLLMAAECEIEVGSLAKAHEYVNMIRNRAKNSNKVSFDNGTPAANYVVEPYNDVFPDKATAWKAVRFERKLELAMEGHRFFDLVRWGADVAIPEINAYIAKESTLHTQFVGAKFEECDFYYPIPLQQIELSQGTLTQTNTGCN